MVESESMQPPYLTLIELSMDGMPVMKNSTAGRPAPYMGDNQSANSMLSHSTGTDSGSQTEG